ncbi:MAG: hypothetical protein KAG26_02800, partial [Methylococcales bacterium]|nr:hypothetical protein [Methylococcales bacterium]
MILKKEIESKSFSKTTVLFLSVNSNTASEKYTEELKNIKNSLQLAQMQEQFNFEEQSVVQLDDVNLAYQKTHPQIGILHILK